MNQEDLSAWCNSLPDAQFLVKGEIQYGQNGGKRDANATLDLEDLLQDHVYEE